MLENTLSQLGLTPMEAKVYLAILALGSASLSDIAAKGPFNRSSLYPVLESLSEKKFLFLSIKGKRTRYTAEAPEKIKLILKDKLSMLDEALPELLLIANKSAVKPKIRFREGYEGIKQAFIDSLHAKDSVLLAFCGADVLTSIRNKSLQTFWEKEYVPKRTKLGKSVQIIFPDNEVGKYMRGLDKSSSRESRFVPASQYPFECEIHVYDNTVAFISYNEKEEFALQVESPYIARTVKMIWRIVWNVAY